AVTKHLLQAGWTVHALVNDPKHSRALALQVMGAILYRGSISDLSSTETAIKGCTAVYLNQMPSFTDVTEESRSAASLVSIAKAAGVKHVVHATSLGLNQRSGDQKAAIPSDHPGVRGKVEVEALVRDCGLTWTIIRPGYFMSNFMPPLSGFMFPELQGGKFVTSFEPDTVLPLVDPSDIGAMATAAMEDPTRFEGQVVSIVSEKLTVAQIIAQLSTASGKQIEFVARTPE
ncbi:NAD(P)-binding protein, partial [Lophiostoma macrostomum CBS 122681]